MPLLQTKGYKNYSQKEKQKILKKYLTNPLISAIIFRHDGRLAQLGEHLPYKQRVTGSSPVLSTKENIWVQSGASHRVGREPVERIAKAI